MILYEYADLLEIVDQNFLDMLGAHTRIVKIEHQIFIEGNVARAALQSIKIHDEIWQYYKHCLCINGRSIPPIYYLKAFAVIKQSKNLNLLFLLVFLTRHHP
jgi:hypothetical protein